MVLLRAAKSTAQPRILPEPLAYRVEASRCALQAGDHVTPDTVIGVDWKTGKTVRAESEGQVESISFHGGDHALIVLITPLNTNKA